MEVAVFCIRVASRRSSSGWHTQALREHAVLFLEIRDHVPPTRLDPPGEHYEQQLKRLKRWGHCSEVYRLTNHRGSSSSRLAHCPIASFEFLDTTPYELSVAPSTCADLSA